MKHTKAEDTISINVSQEKDHVIIEIKDTGTGIAAAEIDKIFDRFYQTEHLNSLNTGAGTGIGLALTKGIVELHHGTIRVESEPGKGSSFIITLKLGKEHFTEEQIAKDDTETIQQTETIVPSVEIHRLRTTRQQLLSQEEEFEKKLNEQVEEANSTLGNRIEKAEEKTRNLQTKMQRDYIAILGVFAAVVLAFNSGIGFSSSAITAAGLQPSFANLSFVVLLVGFVLANSMAILLGFVWKLVRTGDGSKIPRAALWLLIVLDILMLLGLVILGYIS